MSISRKGVNLFVFGTLILLSTAMGALMGYWLCLMVYAAPYNTITFKVPSWLYWATGMLIPVVSFLQALLLFKLYLFVQTFENEPWEGLVSILIAFFVPLWILISPWTLLWGTLGKWHHVAPADAVSTLISIVNASVCGSGLLINAFIAAMCVAIYGTFVIQALRNLFGDFVAFKLPGQTVQTGESCASPGS